MIVIIIILFAIAAFALYGGIFGDGGDDSYGLYVGLFFLLAGILLSWLEAYKKKKMAKLLERLEARGGFEKIAKEIDELLLDEKIKAYEVRAFDAKKMGWLHLI